MDRAQYDAFTQRLHASLEADGRVLGLVAMGSMSGELPEADAYSDHDFFVVVRTGEQERMRTDLSWLPDAGEIVLAFRETAHGVKVVYRSGLQVPRCPAEAPVRDAVAVLSIPSRSGRRPFRLPC